MVFKMKFIFVLIFFNLINWIYSLIRKIIFTNKTLYSFLKGSIYMGLTVTAGKAVEVEI